MRFILLNRNQLMTERVSVCNELVHLTMEAKSKEAPAGIFSMFNRSKESYSSTE